MPNLTLPNLDRIAKENIEVFEAFKKVQDFQIQNVTPVPGNIVAAPPASTPVSTPAKSATPVSAPRVPPPPFTGNRSFNTL